MKENIKAATELVDIRTVTVEQDLPKPERIIEYVRQLKDPYLYICGKYTITARHPDSGPTLEECLQGMMA